MASKAMLHYQREDILIKWFVVASQKERERVMLSESFSITI
jgi:hypothetical protein